LFRNKCCTGAAVARLHRNTRVTFTGVLQS
jgi:hypothetical protein